MMKKYLLLILLCVFALQYALAQDNTIKIKDFYLNEFDNTANTHGTIVYDENNGEKCALIKIRTNVQGFSFNAGFLGITKTEQKIGEVWVYVPQGVKKLTIAHPTLATLEYNFPTGQVERARTYIMVLEAKEAVDMIVEDDSKKGILKFNVIPVNANVTVNSVPLALDTAGNGELELFYGRHAYKVTAEDYHPVSGRVRINDNQKEQTVNIRLKQNYGWLKIQFSEYMDSTAKVFIDGHELNHRDKDSIKITSGQYTFEVKSPLYNTYQTTLNILDSTLTPLYVKMYAQYGTVRFKADNTSHIYCDSTYLGQGSWEGKLPTGQHIIECRAEGHIPSVKEIEVTRLSVTEHFLSNPTPIYGIIDINSTPEGADVYIDGALVGKTPLTKGNVLIGKRNITLISSGFSAEHAVLEVFKDSVSKAEYTLSNKMFVQINTTPENCKLVIDDNEVGTTPYADTIAAGEHLIEISHTKRYKPINKTIIIDGDNTNLTFELKKNFVRKNEFYIEGVYSMSADAILGVSMGLYLGNFNIEGGALLPKEPSETIYWNPIINNNPLSSSESASYAPTHYYGKIGYGIPLSRNFRITPQVGMQVTSLYIDEGSTSYGEQANRTSCTVSARMNFAFAPFMGICITPEYRIPVKDSEGYKIISDLLPTIQGYNNGFNINLGLYIFL